MSKKVFIGGRDLEKAAEEYNKNFQEVNRNLELYALTQRKKNTPITVKPTRTSSQKHRFKSNAPKRGKLASQKLLNSKTEYLLQIEEDIHNLDLNPWIVDNDNFN